MKTENKQIIPEPTHNTFVDGSTIGKHIKIKAKLRNIRKKFNLAISHVTIYQDLIFYYEQKIIKSNALKNHQEIFSHAITKISGLQKLINSEEKTIFDCLHDEKKLMLQLRH